MMNQCRGVHLRNVPITVIRQPKKKPRAQTDKQTEGRMDGQADSTDRDKQTVPTEPEKKLVQHIASNQADSRQYRQNPKKN